MIKTVGIIALAVACLLLAILNLWNLFKDWFKEHYRKKH